MIFELENALMWPIKSFKPFAQHLQTCGTVIFTYILWWTNLFALLYEKTSSKQDFIGIDFVTAIMLPIQ